MQVNFQQAVDLIAAVGQTDTVMLQGQPGVGKTAVMHALAKLFPEHIPAYIDCATLDLGDLGMPVVDREAMVTHYAPNARFHIRTDSNRPVLLNLDELSKAPRPVLNMLLPLPEERRVGDRRLPAGSIVYGTGNLITDGVGDNLPAHAYSRLIPVDFRNPTTDEWLGWAVEAGIDPLIMLYVRETPQVFERYDELGTGKTRRTNPRIFDPLAGQVRAYTCPRTFAKASNIVKVREQIGDAFLPALAGAIGEVAAQEINALVHMSASVPTRAAIAASPDKCKLPQSAAAAAYLAYVLASADAPDHLPAYIAYVGRWTDEEAVTLFAEVLTARAVKAKTIARLMAVPGFTPMAARAGKFF